MGKVTQRGERTSWGDGTILFLDCGGGYTTLCICQNVGNCPLKRVYFIQELGCEGEGVIVK